MSTNVGTNHHPLTGIAGQVTTNATTGQVLINNGASWITAASPYTYTPMMTQKVNGTVVLKTKNGEVSVDEIVDFMEIMKSRLAILTPALEQHEHFPALKEAYENYLLMERLCLGDKDKT